MNERTDEEIVNRLRAVEKTGEDFLGVIQGDLLGRLSFEAARPWLKKDTTEEQWRESISPKDRKSVLQEAFSYYRFACEKCDDERGISAARSIQHYQTWLWLMGEDTLLAFLESSGNYSPFGRPILVRIGEHFGWSWGQTPEVTPETVQTF